MGQYLVELDDGRKFEVEADAPPTESDVMGYLGAEQAVDEPQAPSEPLFDASDFLRATGQALGGITTTAPHAYRQLGEGLGNPWKRSPEYLASQQAMRQYNQELEEANKAAQESGDISVLSRGMRGTGQSLGFMGGAMGSSLVGGNVAGTAGRYLGSLAGPEGAAAGELVGRGVGALGASYGAAYRMAGAQFLDDAREAIDAKFQRLHNRLPTEEEQEEAYQELLPLAESFSHAEAGPEAIGNLALGVGGKYVLGLGRKKITQLADSALAKVLKKTVAGTAAAATEFGGETVTEVEQNRIDEQARAAIAGEAPPEQPPRSVEEYVKAFGDIAPTTATTMALLGGAGVVAKGAQRLMTPSAEPTEETEEPLILGRTVQQVLDEAATQAEASGSPLLAQAIAEQAAVPPVSGTEAEVVENLSPAVTTEQEETLPLLPQEEGQAGELRTSAEGSIPAVTAEKMPDTSEVSSIDPSAEGVVEIQPDQLAQLSPNPEELRQAQVDNETPQRQAMELSEADPIMVMRQKDGTLKVVQGHHRLARAMRDQVPLKADIQNTVSVGPLQPSPPSPSAPARLGAGAATTPQGAIESPTVPATAESIAERINRSSLSPVTTYPALVQDIKNLTEGKTARLQEVADALFEQPMQRPTAEKIARRLLDENAAEREVAASRDRKVVREMIGEEENQRGGEAPVSDDRAPLEKGEFVAWQDENGATQEGVLTKISAGRNNLGEPMSEVTLETSEVVQVPRRELRPMASMRPDSRDAEYMAAVEAGDMEKAQRMVDEVAKAAGFSVGPVWRGEQSGGRPTSYPRRDRREPGIFTTDNKKVADGYDRKGQSRPFFLRGPVLDLRGDEDFELSTEGREFVRKWAEDAGWDFVERQTGEEVSPEFAVASGDLFDWEGGWSSERWKDLQATAFGEGFNTVILRDRSGDAETGYMDSFVARNSESLKSADPVTYDDAGNVIPLSQRFQSASPDIRFSKKPTNPVRDARAAAIKSLRGHLGKDVSVGVSAVDAINAMTSLQGAVPGVQKAWIGTREDFLADGPLGRAFPGVRRELESARGDQLEGLFDGGRAFVFINNVGVYEGDVQVAKEQSELTGEEVTPQQAAVQRVITHEGLVHRGFYALDKDTRRALFQWGAQNIYEAEMDAMAEEYGYADDWRTNERSREWIMEEILAKKIERLKAPPKSGPLKALWDILVSLWRRLTGSVQEVTLKDIQDVAKVLRTALELSENNVETRNGMPIRVEVAQGSLRPRFTSPLDATLSDTAKTLRLMRDGPPATPVDLQAAYASAVLGKSSAMVSLDDLFAAAKESNPSLTEADFGQQVQNLYNDNGAYVEPAESPAVMKDFADRYNVRSAQGIPATYVMVLEPQRPMASMRPDRNAKLRESLPADVLAAAERVVSTGKVSEEDKATLKQSGVSSLLDDADDEATTDNLRDLLGVEDASYEAQNAAGSVAVNQAFSNRAALKSLAEKAHRTKQLSPEEIQWLRENAPMYVGKTQADTVRNVSRFYINTMDLDRPMASMRPDSRDAEYMAAVEAGDMEKAQRMVDKAAGRFASMEEVDPREFSYSDEDDQFFYHVTDKERLERIVYEGEGLRPNNQGQFAGAAAQANSRGKVFFTERSGVKVWVNEVERQLEHSKDYEEDTSAEDDLAVIRIPKHLVQGKQDDDPRNSPVRVGRDFFTTQPIPSFPEAVVRDDAGNVIPLSQRFQSASPDIRASYRLPSGTGEKLNRAVWEAQEASGPIKDSEQTPLKDFPVHSFAQQSGESRTAVAIQIVDAMLKSGVPVNGLTDAINSYDLHRQLGIERDPDMLGILLAEAMRRGDPNAFKAYQVTRERAGRALGTGAILHKDPRFQHLFLLEGMKDEQMQQARDILNANAPMTADEVSRLDAEAGRTAAAELAASTEDNIFQAGEEALSKENRTLWERIKGIVSRLGVIAGIKARRTQAKPSIRVSETERQELENMTPEQLEAEERRLQAEFRAVAREFLGVEASEAELAKLRTTAERRQQKKRAEVFSGTDSKAFRHLIEQARKRSGDKAPLLPDSATWTKIFSGSPQSQEAKAAEMVEYMKADPLLANLNPEEQQQLADMFARRWEQKRKELLEAKVASILKARNATPKGKNAAKDAVPKFIQAINRGELTNDVIAEEIAEKFGFEKLTEGEKKTLERLSRELQEPGIPQHEKTAKIDEMAQIIAKKTRTSMAEILSAWWVTSVLSGPRTAFTIGLAASNGAFEVLGHAVSTVLNANWNGRRAEGVAAAGQALKNYFKSWPRAIQLAWQYVLTGDKKLLSAIDPAYSQFFETGRNNPLSVGWRLSQSKNPVARATGRFMHFFEKLLSALDLFTATTTRHGMLPIAYYLNQKVYDKARVASETDLANYRKKVLDLWWEKKEPTTGTEQALVTRQAINMMESELTKYANVLEDAGFAAAQAAMTLTPEGLGGQFYQAVRSLANKAERSAEKFVREAEKLDGRDHGPVERNTRKALAYIYRFLAYQMLNVAGLRFARFAGNKLNQSLGFIPGLGLLRKFEKDYAGPMKNQAIMRNQTIGAMMTLVGYNVLKAIADEPDDDKRGWGIEGSWKNLTPDQIKQLQAAGRKQYTIKWGDLSFNYANWPVSSVLAAIGTMADRIKYSPDKWKETSALDKIATGAWAASTATMDASSLSQLAEVFGSNIHTRDPVEASAKWASRVFGNYAGGMIPRVFKDADMILDGKMGKYEGWENFGKEIPVYRRYVGGPLLDIFGKQVEVSRTPWSREFQAQPPEREYRLLGQLNSNDLWLTPANPGGRRVGRGKRSREMTDAEQKRYVTLVGDGYRKVVLKHGDRLVKMGREEAKDLLGKLTAQVRDRAERQAVTQQ